MWRNMFLFFFFMCFRTALYVFSDSGSIEVVFHSGHLPFTSSSIQVVFHWGCLPFSSSSEVVFHSGRLPFRSSSIQVIFHSGCLPFRSSCVWCHLLLRSSSIEVIFNWGHLPLRLSSIEVLFHWGCLTNVWYLHMAQIWVSVLSPVGGWWWGWVGRSDYKANLSRSWSFAGVGWACQKSEITILPFRAINKLLQLFRMANCVHEVLTLL